MSLYLHPPVVSVGVGGRLPPALSGVWIQDAVVRMHGVAQVHALLLLS